MSYDPFDGENRNVDEARIEGIEATYEYDAAPWHARVEAIHQDPRNLTTDELLLRRARDSLTVSVQRAFGPLRFRPRRAGGGRTQGLRLAEAGDARRLRAREPHRDAGR